MNININNILLKRFPSHVYFLTILLPLVCGINGFNIGGTSECVYESAFYF